MASTGGDLLVYNGELYNYVELRRSLGLAAGAFVSTSDTEVALRSLSLLGPAKAFSSFNGMWALAWLDPGGQRLVLSRDRAGEKPLYYVLTPTSLYFASEIKTLLRLMGNQLSLNPTVINAYIQQALLNASRHTFLNGIVQLEPGSWLELDLSSPTLSGEPVQFWDCNLRGAQARTISDFIDELLAVLFDSVQLRLRSDVPTGVLLSGGLDSSCIAAVTRQVSGPDAPLTLLSATSSQKEYSEERFIDLTAAHLGAQAQKVNIDLSPTTAMELLETVSWYNDQPVGSFAAVAHFLLMRAARDLGVTVILSGQGADELLCGYRKYLAFYIQDLVRRRKFGTAMSTARQFYANGTVLAQFNLAEARRYIPSPAARRGLDIRGEALRGQPVVDLGLGRRSVEERQALDFEHFSIPALTHYEDRMSMAWSREIRLPYLDVRLVELTLGAPVEWKLHNGWTKYALRRAMNHLLPQEIVWRKDKQGFLNPEAGWLREQLRSQVLEVFSPESLIFHYGLVDRQALLQKYNQYCTQRPGNNFIWGREVFAPIALELWLRCYNSYIK